MSKTPHLRVYSTERAPDEAAPATVEEAFRQYAGYVATIAYRILGRDGDVDDVVQDVFIDAMSGIAQVRDPASIKGWLGTVTVRCASRRLRRRRLRGFFGMDQAPDYALVASEGATPEQRALLGRVYMILDGIPVKDRVAWTLRYIEEEKLEDVARMCGCSLATAKRRIAAAQDAVERGFDDET